MNITVKKARNAAAISAGALALGGVGAAFALRRAFRPRNDFDGKVVVVTGGARGLGFALAQEFARRGAKVAINSRSESEVASARDKLAALNFPCYAAVCDITDRQQVETFLSAVRSHLGPIDVLVNNAGIIQVGPFANQKIEDFEEAMAINFWGAVYNTYAALPDMLARRRGNIVNISSIGGKIAVPHLLPYSASKFALTGFSEGLNAELHGSGVNVTTVCPGLMRTGSQFNALFKGQNKKEFAWFLLGSSTPLSSINARRAACQIVNATKRNQRELIITWQAELASRVHGVLPELSGAVLARVNKFLPDAGSDNESKIKGADSESAMTRNPITTSNRIAARRLNERQSA